MRKDFLLLTLMSCFITAQANHYLVSSKATLSGASIAHQGKTFTVGLSAFQQFSQLLSATLHENDTVYVDSGTWSEDVTVTTPGLKFKGINAHIDSRASTRANISQITGTWTINANNIEIDGFDFTGIGCIRNINATKAQPLSNLTIHYCRFYGSTLSRDIYHASIKLGNILSDASAANADATNKYINTQIAHNIFEGTNTPHFIQIAGAGSFTTIEDNSFTSGATSIRFDHGVGTFKVCHNRFKNVGTETTSLGGDFCVQINRCALTPSIFNIQSNEFDGCMGQKSLYPVIRFFPGDIGVAGEVNPAVGTKVNINYNLFKNKTKIHTDYNYIYYANQRNTLNVQTDMRWNRVDRTDYQYAFCDNPGNRTGNNFRYCTGGFGLIDPDECTFATYKSGLSLKDVTVMQCFDIDERTGDLYAVQLHNSPIQSDPKGLTITRITPSGSKQYMYACWGGHGTNMAVGYVNGKLNIFMGGNGTLNSAGTETTSGACRWFEFVNGATVNLKSDKTSFTYGGKTYPIGTYHSSNWLDDYPAIDEENRIFATRTIYASYNRYQFLDLDDVLTNGSNATVKKTINISKNEHPTSISGDNGYLTFSHQGWTVRGTYLYLIEGVSESNNLAIGGAPTLFLHVYNWRTGQFLYRKRLNNNTIAALLYGESEGIKVHRNSAGQDVLYTGYACGASGARTVTIHSWTMPNKAISYDQTTLSADQTAISFSDEKKSDNLTIRIGNVFAPCNLNISGADASAFSINTNTIGAWLAQGMVRVSYAPQDSAGEHHAFLRVTSTTAQDIVIPLTGTQTILPTPPIPIEPDTISPIEPDTVIPSPADDCNPYGWHNGEDMYQALAADIWDSKNNGINGWKFASGFAGIFGAPDITGNSSGVALDIQTFDETFFSTSPYKEKWAWLLNYLESRCQADGKTGPISAGDSHSALIRYNLAAFFANSIRTNEWPYTADYTNHGVNSTQYNITWGTAFCAEGLTTDWHSPINRKQQVEKVLIDGKLYIRIGGTWYNTIGQAL